MSKRIVYDTANVLDRDFAMPVEEVRSDTVITRDKHRKKRAKRLLAIKKAVSTVEDRLAIDLQGSREAIRALYYLERLARKAN